MLAVFFTIVGIVGIFLAGKSARRDWRNGYEDSVFYFKLCGVAIGVASFLAGFSSLWV